MASIEKRGSGWSVRWKDLSNANRRRQCPSRRVAETLKREIESELALGRDWAPSQAEQLLEDTVKAYMGYQRRRLAATSIAGMKSVLSRWLYWLEQVRGGGRRALLSDLTRPMLEVYHYHLTSPAGGACAASTARFQLGHIERFWRWAFEEVEGVPRPRSLRLIGAPSAQVRAPTYEQMDAVLQRLRGVNLYPATVARFTGLRVGQIMRLKWEDLDLTEGLLRIRPELGKTRAEQRGRELPLSPHLVALLRDEELWPRTSDYVVPMKRKGRQLSTRSLLRAWEKTGAHPQIWRRRSFHAFRKGVRTFLEVEGVSMRVVNYLIGHSDSHVSARYVDPRHFDLRGAVELIPPLDLSRWPRTDAELRRRSPGSAPITEEATMKRYGTEVSWGGQLHKAIIPATSPRQAAEFAASLVDPTCELEGMLHVVVVGDVQPEADFEVEEFSVVVSSAPRHIATALEE